MYQSQSLTFLKFQFNGAFNFMRWDEMTQTTFRLEKGIVSAVNWVELIALLYNNKRVKLVLQTNRR